MAQGVPQTAVSLARVDLIQRTAVGKVCQLAGGRERKSAPAKASGYVFSSRRPQVADAKPPTRRGGIGG